MSRPPRFHLINPATPQPGAVPRDEAEQVRRSRTALAEDVQTIANLLRCTVYMVKRAGLDEATATRLVRLMYALASQLEWELYGDPARGDSAEIDWEMVGQHRPR